MRALRTLTVAAVACLATTLAACGSSAPTPPTIHAPGVGATLQQVQKFFESQGGGHWQAGAITGGIVGYAVGDGSGPSCPVSLGGTPNNINGIHVFCSFGGAVASTATQAQSILTATVHRFAPGATDWTRQKLQVYLDPSTTASLSGKKVAGKNAVILTRASDPSGELNLTIEPEVLTLKPPIKSPTPITTTTTTKK